MRMKITFEITMFIKVINTKFSRSPSLDLGVLLLFDALSFHTFLVFKIGFIVVLVSYKQIIYKEEKDSFVTKKMS